MQRLILTIFCFCLTSCSSTNWAIQWADTFLSWKINKQFEFSGEAKKTVKQETTLLINEIRHTHFPILSQQFQQVAQEVRKLEVGNETENQKWVTAKVQWAEEFVQSLSKPIEPYALKIAALVEKENWESFLENFEKENKRILKSKSKCVDKFEDHLEDWLGDVTKSQMKFVEAYCQSQGDGGEKRVANRKFQLAKFQESWESSGEVFHKTSFLSAVGAWVRAYRQNQNPESQVRFEESKKALIQTLTSILGELTAPQRRELAENLESRGKGLRAFVL